MRPESQSLESSFEPSAEPLRGDPAGASDGMIEDFNAFFERLSSLDELHWGPEDDSAPAEIAAPPAQKPTRPASAKANERAKPAMSTKPAARPKTVANAKAATGIPPASAAKPPAAAKSAAPAKPPVAGKPAARPQVAMGAKTPAGAKPGVAKSPRMTVVTSETVAKPVPMPKPELPPSVDEGRVGVRDVARFLKTTLVGLALFAFGLAAGWAALSLPSHFHHHMPSFAQLAERARAMALPRFGAAPPAKDAPTAKAVANGTPAQGTIAAPAAPETPDTLDPDANLQLPKLGDSIAVSPAKAAPAAMHARPVAKATQPSAKHTGRSAKAAPRPATTPPTHVATTSSPAAPTAPAGPRYTLQVGACTSYACVHAYQQLLQSKVDPRTIKVVTESRKGAPNLQRVRIQPLDHSEAKRLKAKLAAMDPRFKGAYLIALH